MQDRRTGRSSNEFHQLSARTLLLMHMFFVRASKASPPDERRSQMGIMGAVTATLMRGNEVALSYCSARQGVRLMDTQMLIWPPQPPRRRAGKFSPRVSTAFVRYHATI